MGLSPDLLRLRKNIDLSSIYTSIPSLNWSFLFYQLNNHIPKIPITSPRSFVKPLMHEIFHTYFANPLRMCFATTSKTVWLMGFCNSYINMHIVDWSTNPTHDCDGVMNVVIINCRYVIIGVLVYQRFVIIYGANQCFAGYDSKEFSGWCLITMQV